VGPVDSRRAQKHVVDLGLMTRREAQMKLLSGKYPKLAMVALVASIMVANVAAKKWA
jgi:hypothetical protein